MARASTRSAAERPALDLMELAVGALRQVPVTAWLAYGAGTIPFALALMEFWLHMTQSAFAAEAVGAKALATALAYLWMKCWQTVFAAHLRSAVSRSGPPSWSARKVARMVAVQCAIQPLGLVARPVALLITLPYAWVNAFFHTVTLQGDGATGNPMEVERDAARLVRGWVGQNHTGLALLFGVYGFLFLNLAVAALAAPMLLRSLLGMDIAAGANPFLMLNGTFFVAVAIAAYAAADPFFKAFYAVRGFLLGAVTTGDDLRAQLRRPASAVAAAAFLGLLLTLPGPAPLAAASPGPAPPQPTPAWSAEQLEAGIEGTLRDPKFAWRMPRVEVVESEGWLDGFFAEVGRTLKAWGRPVRDWVLSAIRWLGELFPDRDRETPDADSLDLSASLPWVVGVLCAILIGLAAYLLHQRARRSPRGEVEPTERVPLAADLERPEVAADQFPEEEWIALGERLLAEGDARLAIRAFYLALLAHLARREWIRIARHKSDTEYERELSRRTHGSEQWVVPFRESVALFQGVWYGSHPANPPLALAARDLLDRMRTA